ncbi:hypothetical protein ABZZ20_01545 [Streptomyces sp. NPDC006430]|uniref:hypothetical protein n=1 Tax=Streptomyces sp. NPDC006430 TaxID=3154299 RepID=UPI0033A2E1B2
MNADPIADETAAPLLLDGVLPEFACTRVECVVVPARPSVAYRAARDLDLLTVHGPLLDLAMWVRGVPDRVRRRPVPLPTSLRIADLFDTVGDEDQPWVGLGEDPGHEIVFGAVGTPWKPSITWRRIEPEAFAAFDEPGWAKMAAALVVHPHGTHRSLLVYEVRTSCTDPSSTARFRRYWTFVAPGVGLVLRGALRAVAEAAADVPRSEGDDL